MEIGGIKCRTRLDFVLRGLISWTSLYDRLLERLKNKRTGGSINKESQLRRRASYKLHEQTCCNLLVFTQYKPICQLDLIRLLYVTVDLNKNSFITITGQRFGQIILLFVLLI